MKIIKLSQQGKNREKFVTLVSDGDYDYLNQFNWYAKKSGNTFYAVKNEYTNGKKKNIYMHRLLLNVPFNMQVDHIDHDGLNNQRSNIRICTQRQNNCNVLPRGRSKYLGVSYNEKYIVAKIRINRILLHLGIFKTEEDAAYAYDAKAKELHGEFASLNFPENNCQT